MRLSEIFAMDSACTSARETLSFQWHGEPQGLSHTSDLNRLIIDGGACKSEHTSLKVYDSGLIFVPFSRLYLKITNYEI